MTRNLTESIFPNSELIFVGKTNMQEIREFKHLEAETTQQTIIKLKFQDFH